MDLLEYEPVFEVDYDGIVVDVTNNADPKRPEAFMYLPLSQQKPITLSTPRPPAKNILPRNANGSKDSGIVGSASSSRSCTPTDESPNLRASSTKGVKLKVTVVNGCHQAVFPIVWNTEWKCYTIPPAIRIHSFSDIESYLIGFLKKRLKKNTSRDTTERNLQSPSADGSDCNDSSTENGERSTEIYEIVGLNVQVWKTPEQLKAFLDIFVPPEVPAGYAAALFENILPPVATNDRKRKLAPSAVEGLGERKEKVSRSAQDVKLSEIAEKKSNHKSQEEIADVVNAMSILLSSSGDAGVIDAAEDSPLIAAVKNKNHLLVKILLLNGADIHWRDLDGRTPLHFAAKNGDLEMVKMLWEADDETFKERSADPIDVFLRTPLMMAAEGGSLPAIQFLLEKGAYIGHRDWENETVLHRQVHGTIGKPTFDRKLGQFLVESGCSDKSVNTRNVRACGVAAQKLVHYAIPNPSQYRCIVPIMQMQCDMFFSAARQRISRGTILWNVSSILRRPDFVYQYGLTVHPESEAFVQTKPTLGWVVKNCCTCVGPCSVEKGCTCLNIPNRGLNAFDSRGHLVQDFPETQPIVMCPAMCHCPATCPMKSLQNALQPRMEIFHVRCPTTKKIVWKVRTLQALEAGQFITFLGGELIHPRFMVHEKPYRYWPFSQTLSVDSSRRANASRFFSDMENANVRMALVREYDALKPPQVAYFAKEAIDVGEMLSVDRNACFRIIAAALRDQAFTGYVFDKISSG